MSTYTSRSDSESVTLSETCRLSLYAPPSATTSPSSTPGTLTNKSIFTTSWCQHLSGCGIAPTLSKCTQDHWLHKQFSLSNFSGNVNSLPALCSTQRQCFHDQSTFFIGKEITMLEYPEAVRACAMRRHLRDLVTTCLFNCSFFFAFFAVGHIYLS